jgi:hypothetical protein
MDRRTITIGLTLSVAIYIASIILLKALNLIGHSVYDTTNGYSALLFNRLDDILEITPWFVPGFIVGYI